MHPAQAPSGPDEVRGILCSPLPGGQTPNPQLMVLKVFNGSKKGGNRAACPHAGHTQVLQEGGGAAQRQRQ